MENQNNWRNVGTQMENQNNWRNTGTQIMFKKPCDRFNLEGKCKWEKNCRYSHMELTREKWEQYYPGLQYTPKYSIVKKKDLTITDLYFKLVELNSKLNQVCESLQITQRDLYELYRKNKF